MEGEVSVGRRIYVSRGATIGTELNIESEVRRARAFCQCFQGNCISIFFSIGEMRGECLFRL